MKISEMTTALTLNDSDLLELAQVDAQSASGYASCKATLIAIGIYLNKLANYTSDLQTSNKTIIGAINELKQLISLIPQFSIEVVQTLPVSDISETTIYLVPSSDPEQGNYYEEYIYVNNTWELVGTTAVDLSAYYTKLEVDGLLAAKANTSDVTAALALKEAKADMDDDVTDIVVGLTDEHTTTAGNPVTLTTEQSGGAKSAVVTFTPKQSGTGDPSPDNVRPISGWDSLSLFGMGKNIAVGKIEDAGYNSSGRINNSDTSYIIIAPIKKGGTYTFSENGVISSTYYGEFTSYPAKQMIAVNGRESGGTFTASVDGYVAILCGNDVVRQIELGSTATDYEAPITPTTHTATFDSTIYGGSYDFVSGKGVRKFLIADLGTLSWIKRDNLSVFISMSLTNIIKKSVDTTTIPTWLYCSIYRNEAATNVYRGDSAYNYTISVNNNGYIIICNADYTNLNDFINAMSGIMLCYELATPTPISLPPADVNLLKGLNTVWSDANGTVTVGYSKLPNGNLGAVVDYIKKLEARVKALET